MGQRLGYRYPAYRRMVTSLSASPKPTGSRRQPGICTTQMTISDSHENTIGPLGYQSLTMIVISISIE
ncbi:hypothetical protein ACK8P5_25890 (plasmid) [Paenibacillus sp. EC2-1]|uniref:hypothetical protein n=1 Tax=Paenibacillus sp. EC2-1 TaxID=3388665 RepID=UPI003BEF40A2